MLYLILQFALLSSDEDAPVDNSESIDMPDKNVTPSNAKGKCIVNNTSTNGNDLETRAGAESTEEEDEVVDVLLSLSNSMPGDSSLDSFDNSNILPIGTAPIDAAPVQIKLGTEDVYRELAKLKVNSNEPKSSTAINSNDKKSEIVTTMTASSSITLLLLLPTPSPGQ